MIQFREFLEKRIADTEEPLKSIPEAHLPLIAKLAHERRVKHHWDVHYILIT
jgi:hypothetical protein